MTVRINGSALFSLKGFVEELPQTTRRAARLSVNDTTQKKAMPRFRRAIKDQVRFPGGYLSKDRLGVTKKATDADLTAIVTARFRPTSLSRFARNQSFDAARRLGGVRVNVKKGSGSKKISGAFFVKLNRGRDTSDGFNLGLAIRLKAGQRLRGRRKGGASVRISENVYLLYGPSIDQVFSDVAVDETGAVLAELEREFLRQFVRLSSNG